MPLRDKPAKHRSRNDDPPHFKYSFTEPTDHQHRSSQPVDTRASLEPVDYSRREQQTPLPAHRVTAPDRDKLAALKLPIPNDVATLNHSTMQRSVDKRDRLKDQKSRNIDSRSTFDDTTSLNEFDFDDSNMDDSQTQVWRGSSATNIAIDELHEQPEIHQKADATSRYNLEREMMNEAEDERVVLGLPLKYRQSDQYTNDKASDNISKAGFNESEDGSLMIEDNQDTPSKSPPIPTKQILAFGGINRQKTVSFDSPVISSAQMACEIEMDQESPHQEQPGSSLRNMQTTNVPPAAETPKVLRMNQVFDLKDDTGKRTVDFSRSVSRSLPSHSRKISSGGSDIPDSSEDEQVTTTTPLLFTEEVLQSDVPNINKRKRQVIDMDYSVEELKTKKPELLFSEPFASEPGHSVSVPAVDSHGNAIHLNQLLANLNRMRSQDQEEFFRHQTDEEWSQTGAWFVEKFQTNLQDLMQARLQRRKISAKFENEIRKRQQQVEWAQGGIEDELSGLKRGGGQLIEGRRPASRIGTPIRNAR